MKLALFLISDPGKHNYSGFFNAGIELLGDYQGCDVLVTCPVATLAQLSSLLSGIYSQLRVAATDAQLGPHFSFNVLFRPIRQYYSLVLKVRNDPVPLTASFSTAYTELFIPLPLNSTTRAPDKDPSQENESLGSNSRGYQTIPDVIGSSLDQHSAHCVAVGGTFDHLHDGHKILLHLAAFCAKFRIIVGISGDALLQKKKFREYLEPLETRICAVVSFLQKVVGDDQRYEIYRIDDVCGPTGYIEAIDGLVISHETALGAVFVNKVRAEKRFRALKIVCANVVGGDADASNNWKGKLSSTDMREMEAKRHKSR